MDTTLRLLSQGGPLAQWLIGGAIACAAIELGFLALGVAWIRRPGPPRQAVVLAALLALPLLLPIWGANASILSGDESDPLLAWTMAIGIRVSAGIAGLILALPVGLSSCLWAGIAAARRSQGAGERARLSATAAGNAGMGAKMVGALTRSRAPEIGAAIGVLASFFLIGAPSLGLLLSSVRLIEGASLLSGVDPSQLQLLGHLVAESGVGALRAGVALGAAGALLVAGLLGTLIHAGSSRRRNLSVALHALDGAGCPGTTREPVLSALAASGKPGPWIPLLLALILGILAAMAWIAAGRLPEGPSEEAIARLSTAPTGLSTGL